MGESRGSNTVLTTFFKVHSVYVFFFFALVNYKNLFRKSHQLKFKSLKKKSKKKEQKKPKKSLRKNVLKALMAFFIGSSNAGGYEYEMSNENGKQVFVRVFFCFAHRCRSKTHFLHLLTRKKLHRKYIFELRNKSNWILTIDAFSLVLVLINDYYTFTTCTIGLVLKHLVHCKGWPKKSKGPIWDP